MTNKTRIEMGLKVLALVLWGIVLIVSCAGLWNAAAGEKPSGFYIGTSVALFVINGVSIFICARRIAKNYEHN